uniref:Uncharacterized protein n=1 Tax=viral metagenome TaxID=1070528 RepID=A0A6C0BQ02_9ZZZZ
MAQIDEIPVNDIYSVSTECTKIRVNIRDISSKRVPGPDEEVRPRFAKERDTELKKMIHSRLSNELEGKCGENGYVQPGSTNVLSISGGYCFENYIVFDVVYECMICSPVEGMILQCIAREVTESAGVRAELDDVNNPMKIYIARDHHIKNELFHTIAIDDVLKVRVFGSRYELNDKHISVIVELLSKI